MKNITADQAVTVSNALKANPMHSDGSIAEGTGVSRNYVKEIRLALGLWTPRRVRYRDGKPEVYHVPPPSNLTAEQCLESDHRLLNISDEMLRQLHSLTLIRDGQEAYQLISDVLEITENKAVKT